VKINKQLVSLFALMNKTPGVHSGESILGKVVNSGSKIFDKEKINSKKSLET
jgi:hypothetical protein